MFEKEGCRKGIPVLSTRYYVSSLPSDAVSAKRFQESIFRHWEVENYLHLEKEESGEDKHVFRNAVLGEVWTFLTGMAGAVVRCV
jgi:predicted transposase YbfD/YdcC